MKKQLFIIAISLVLLQGKSSAVSAATPIQQLRVSPVIIHIPLTPLSETSYEVTVENLTAVPLPLKATFSDFDVATEDGGYVFTDTRTSPLLSWTSLDKTDVILPAKTKETLRIHLKTPQKIPLGGYYGILFFEPVLPQSKGNTLVSARVGVLLLANIGAVDSAAHKGEILSFSSGFLHETPTIPLRVRVKNTSLNFFTAKPMLTISPLLGESHQQALEEKIIFPGKVRRWEYPLRLEGVTYGIYHINIAVSTGGGDILREGQWIIILPWRLGGGMLFVGIIFLLFFVKRKNIGMAASILVGRNRL